MIDYKIIANSVSFYSSAGFKEVNVPWIVSKRASDITLPRDRIATPANSKVIHYAEPVLVGSAEQSFLQLRLDGKLSDGLYQATSPCFRDEMDDTHFPYFMKTELIQISATELSDQQCYNSVLPLAFSFMFNYRTDIHIEKTKDGWDIVTSGGLELGSYGVRQHSDIGYWIYATGVALPRLTMQLP